MTSPTTSMGWPASAISTFSGRMPSQPEPESECARSPGTDALAPCTRTSTCPFSRPWMSASMRLDWPRKFATNVVRGFSYSSSGAPICSISPAFITAMVSAMVMASSWSWVTCTNVIPTSVWMRLSSSCIARRSFRSRAPSGSSSSSTSGLLISARASATRCCWPPDSCAGFLRRLWLQLHQLQHLADLSLHVGDTAPLEAERDVLGDVEVREQCVVLEDGVDRVACTASRRSSRCRRGGSCPDVGVSRPATMRSVVVLPQPDGPSRAKNEPWGTSRSSDFTAVKVVNSFVSCVSCSDRDPGRRRARCLIHL